MKPIRILILAGIAFTAPAISYAQVAGSMQEAFSLWRSTT